MTDATPRRVLIVLMGAIGDVTRALPLLCRLKRAYTSTDFYWAIEPPSAPLLRGHPALAGTVLFDRGRGAARLPDFLRRVRALHPDWTLDLQRHLKSGVTSLASGARRRIGFARQNSREGNFLFQNEHIRRLDHLSSKLRQFLVFADYLDAPPAPVEFGLSLQPAEESEVERLLATVRRPFAAFFVGSTAESRLWFPDRTARVIEALCERGVSSVLLGGPGEERLAQPIAAAARVSVVDLTGKTGLRHLIGIFARARLAVGPDCGPMHIAAAVGIPVVSLWGATSAKRSAPYGSEHLVVEGSADCSPCYLKKCPIGRVCMQAIDPRDVVEKIDQVCTLTGGG